MKILLTDDHAVVRHGLKQILADEFRKATFGEARNAQEALNKVWKEDWDVVVLDITMPGRSGLEVLREIKKSSPRLPVLVLSMHPENQFAVRVLKRGASGYMTKESAPEELVGAIKKVVAGGRYVSTVLAAIQWVVSYKAQYGITVLNLSLGTDSTQSWRVDPFNYAVERAWDAGIVVTVSASNNGPGAGTVTKPADDPLVITVGALDDKGTPGRGDDVMAGFSGAGPTAADGLTKPDLVASGRSVISLRAPGSKVDTAYPGSRVGTAYFKGSGTSFSTAVTSGSAALLLEREPNLTPDQVKARLLGTAAPGPVGNPNVDGHGSLDTYTAAHAGTFGSANQGVPRSLGSGDLQLDRGGLAVNVQTGSFLDPILHILSPVLQLVVGNLTAQNQTFDQVTYFSSEWTGSSWYGSSWYGSSWYGSSWYGSSWYGSSWYGSSWYGSSWYATAWE